MNYEQAIKELQDNLIVIAEIERRQSALLHEHSEWIAQSEAFQRVTEEKLAHVSVTLAEIGDKLNGLIGYVDGMRHPDPS